MKQDRVTRFMISRNFLFFVGNDLALLFRADTDFDKRFFDVLLPDKAPVRTRRVNGGLVHQIFQIRTGKSRCRTGNLLDIHILRQRLIFGVYL